MRSADLLLSLLLFSLLALVESHALRRCGSHAISEHARDVSSTEARARFAVLGIDLTKRGRFSVPNAPNNSPVSPNSNNAHGSPNRQDSHDHNTEDKAEQQGEGSENPDAEEADAQKELDEENEELEYASDSNSSSSSDADPAERVLTEAEVEAQVTSGRTRRLQWQERRRAWRVTRPRSAREADKGYKGAIAERGYTRMTQPSSPSAPGFRWSRITNSDDKEVLITDMNPSRGAINIRHSYGKGAGEDRKSPDEKIWWSDLVMADWRDVTKDNPVQRKELMSIKRSRINAVTMIAKDTFGNDMELITIAAMNGVFDVKGTPDSAVSGPTEIKPVELRNPGQHSGVEQGDADLFDLMARQPHVDRVFKMLEDHRAELGDKNVDRLKLYHEEGRTGQFDIYIFLTPKVE